MKPRIDYFAGITDKYNAFKKKREVTHWLTVTGMDNVDKTTLINNFGAIKKKQSGEITFPSQKPSDINDKQTQNIVKAFGVYYNCIKSFFIFRR